MRIKCYTLRAKRYLGCPALYPVSALEFIIAARKGTLKYFVVQHLSKLLLKELIFMENCPKYMQSIHFFRSLGLSSGYASESLAA